MRSTCLRASREVRCRATPLSRHRILKSPPIVTLYSKFTKALISRNFVRACAPRHAPACTAMFRTPKRDPTTCCSDDCSTDRFWIGFNFASSMLVPHSRRLGVCPSSVGRRRLCSLANTGNPIAISLSSKTICSTHLELDRGKRCSLIG